MGLRDRKSAGDDLLAMSSTGYVFSGTGNDSITGSAGGDTLLGGSGSGLQIGGLGNDRMSGGDGDDILEGGSGNDFLSGDGGTNVYRFSPGFGSDIVSLDGNLDRLSFSGIRPDQLQFTLSGSSSLVVGWSGANDTITINNAFTLDGEGRHSVLAGFVFDDGTVWDANDILRRTIMSTSGDDVVNGSAASDSLNGGSGADQLFGYAGQDRLSGGAGNDMLIGGLDSDSLQGGTGDDLLEGGIGGDLYYFGRGDGHDQVVDSDSTPDNIDTVLVDAALADVSISQVEDDTVITILDTGDTLTIRGGESALAIERIRFTDGNVIDPKTGLPRNDMVQFGVGSGEVEIDAQSSFDTLAIAPGLSLQDFDIGRDGDDLLMANGADSVRFVGWFDSPSSPSVLQVRFADDTLLDFEQLSRTALTQHGTSGDDTLHTPEGFSSTLMGDSGNDFLIGGDRDDVLDGGDGNDILDGGMGDDTLIGGSGNDTYVIDSDGDAVVELPAGGIDTLRIVSPIANVTLSSELENVELIGGGAVNIIGNASDNRLVGNAAVNRIEGGAGNDILDGGAGADVLVGGLGNDIYMIDNTGDSIVETVGEGVDTVQSGVSYTLSNLALENLALLGSTNINGTGNSNDNVIIGNSGNNQLAGLGGNDYLDGGAGADVMAGGVGNDVYIVENAGDSIAEVASSGTDEARSSISFTLGANVENLSLLGSASIVATGNELNNTLLGNTGNNTLIGNAGNDRLDGGAGNDILRGGTGADTYVFGVGSGIDTIVEEDTSITLDVIEVGSGLGASDLAFHWNGSDLVIAIVNGADRLTVKDFKLAGGKVEQLRFLSDGSVLDYSALTAAANGSVPDQTPIFAQALADAQTTADTSFSYAIPAGSFSDADVGDHLDLAATLSDGSALPAWLNFDASTGTFSGTPHTGDVGSIAVRVAATDWANAAVSDVFNLNVVLADDTSPSVVQPLADRVLVQHQAFSFSVPADAFFDPDSGDVLSYTARLSSGDALPTWLSFDLDTLQFSGTPPTSVAGDVAVTVTGTDTRGRSASDAMVLKVQDVNDAPAVSRLIADQVVVQGATIDLSIPDDTFIDPDGGAITLSAALQNGDPLPEWLNFDAQTGHLIGVAGNDAVGVTTVRLRAIDSAGASTYEDFNIVVGDVNDAPVVAAPISDQIAVEAGDFKFKIPNSVFADPDEGDSLTYTVSVLNAPQFAKSYFSYNENTQEIIRIGGTGKLDYWDIGDWTFRVTAKDRLGLTVSDEFKLSVTAAGINHTPVIANGSTLAYPVTNFFYKSIENASAEAGTQISFSVPLLSADARAAGYTSFRFADVDGDTLNYSISPSSGNPITDWTLDMQTGMLNFVAVDNRREYDWLVTATDSAGASVSYPYLLLLNQVPVMQPLPSFVVAEDQPFSFTLPANTFLDEDVGDVLSLRATLADGGALPSWLRFDAATATFSGTPTNDDVGVISIKVTATDSTGASTFNDFSLMAVNTNDAPVLMGAIADQTANEDATFSLTVPAGTFADVDVGDGLSYSAALSDGGSLPAWLKFDPQTQTFSGTPDNDDVGLLHVRLVAADLSDAMAEQTFDLNVLNVNDAPAVQGEVFTLEEDMPLILAEADLVANDTDIDPSHDVLVISGVGSASHGIVTLNGNGDVVFTPDANYNGVAGFSYAVSDGNGGLGQANVVLNIVSVNDAPEVAASLDNQTVQAGTGFSYQLPVAILTDADGDMLQYAATLANGDVLPSWLSFDPGTQTLNGNPGAGSVGAYQIRITATDPSGASADLSFILSVNNQAPVVSSDIAQVSEDVALAAAGNVLGNDYDPDGKIVTVDTPGVLHGLYGTMNLSVDGQYNYTLDNASAAVQALAAGETVVDSFTYQATDGVSSTQGIVQVQVTGSNDAPNTLGETYALNEDAILSIQSSALLSNDSDVDQGDVLTISGVGNTRHGSAALNANGAITFIPDGNYNGEASFSYTVSDGNGGFSQANVVVNVVAMNDAPMAAMPLADQNVNAGSSFSYVFPSNSFIDIDGDALHYTATQFNGDALPAWLHFDEATRTFSGVPTSANAGALQIAVTAIDPAGAHTSESFNLMVVGGNLSPVTVIDTASIVEDTWPCEADNDDDDDDDDHENDSIRVTGNVLANDYDPEGKSLRVANPDTMHGVYGTLTLNVDGKYRYDLDNDSIGVQSLGAGQTVVDAFAYLASDGSNSSLGALQISVSGRNDKPILARQLVDYKVVQNQDFAWRVPAVSFKDVDISDTLSYTARLSNGNALPSWLRFDAATQTFSGHALGTAGQTISVVLTASDGHGGSSTVSDKFDINIVSSGQVGGPITPPPVSHDDDCGNDDDDEGDSEHDDCEPDDDNDDGVCSVSPAIHVDLDLLVQNSQNPSTGQTSQGGNDAAVFAHWLSVNQAVADFLSRQMSSASGMLHLSDMNVDTALLKPVANGFLGSTATGGTNALSLSTSGFNPNKFTGLNEGVAYID